jgi:hypothetical protein
MSLCYYMADRFQTYMSIFRPPNTFANYYSNEQQYVNLLQNSKMSVKFEVLTAVSMKMTVFWVVATSSLVEVYQRFRGPCCLRHQGDEYAARGVRLGYETLW